MSKAFTKESDGDDDESLDADDAPQVRGPRYITRQGYARLREELDKLWHGERPKVTADVQAAAAQGDRSENAEYIYGKKRLREIDRRIRYLSKRLEIVTIVEPRKEQEGGVYFGAWVTIEDEDAVESTFRIVGVDEIDLAARHFSVESPMAKALLGKRVGDQATVLRPKGPTEVTVVGVRYELPATADGKPASRAPVVGAGGATSDTETPSAKASAPKASAAKASRAKASATKAKPRGAR